MGYEVPDYSAPHQQNRYCLLDHALEECKLYQEKSFPKKKQVEISPPAPTPPKSPSCVVDRSSLCTHHHISSEGKAGPFEKIASCYRDKLKKIKTQSRCQSSSSSTPPQSGGGGGGQGIFTGLLRIAGGLQWIRKSQGINANISCQLRSIKPMCIRECICDSKKPKKKLSTNTLHSVESLVDLRSWCVCESDKRKYFLEEFLNRTGMDASFLGGGDGSRVGAYRKGHSSATTSSPNNIKQIGDNLDELHRLLMEKDKRIQSLENKLYKGRNNREDKCEQEEVTIDMTLNANSSSARPPKKKGTKHHTQRKGGPDGDDYVYEAAYSSDYSVDGDLLKYIGTKLLHEGPRRASSLDNAHERIAATDNQIEIETLKTQIHQLKKALEEERKKSGHLSKQLRSCEEAKAELRSRSPMSRAPLQKVASSTSAHQIQQRELVHQIEEGRKLLNIKHKEIRILQDQINSLENKLSAKVEVENELKVRLNSTSALLKRCEEHGRELAASNQEQTKEIRKLKSQLEKMIACRNNNNTNEVCPVTVAVPVPNCGGGEHMENYLRAKSHRKALAWQKKYLSSVIVMYKSILRQVGHGTEHPDLIQTQIPLAPNAVGLLERPKGRVKFRLIGYTVLAVIRMKYMVNRWLKKRPVEGSPDSEYKASRQPLRMDPNSVIRPSSKSILVHNRINNPPTLDFDERGGNNVDTISEYISRFESIENEISSSLSRK